MATTSRSFGESDLSWSSLTTNGGTLCDSCKGILSKAYDPRITLQMRERDIVDGCRFCDVIKEALEHVFPDSVAEDGGRKFYLGGYTSSCLTIKDLIGTFRPAKLFITSDVQSESPISFIKSTLAGCLMHERCKRALRQPTDPNAWPARVIEIRDDTIRVVKFEAGTMAGEFAALSYCWGSPEELRRNPPFRLTTSTMAELQPEPGVPISKMPRTLRDTFDLCKLLDIPYVWIDALCIIQAQGPDDLAAAEDWGIESTKMQTVYSRSKLTIITAAAESCHSGFLHHGVHQAPAVLKSAQPLLQGLEARGLQLVIKSFGTQSGFHLGNDDMRHDPISKRAWTYQEEMLSTRYIKFTDGDAQWKCETSTQCMCGRDISDVYLQQWDSGSPTDTDNGNGDSILRWTRMVCYYFHRSVTVETDKLVAISGLARRLELEIKGPGPGVGYYAGIWNCASQSEMAYQLTWRNLHPFYHVDGNDCLYTRYVAPTFSWASLDGSGRRMIFDMLEWSISGTHAICKVTDMHTTLVRKDDPFGRVSAGSMTIRGLVQDCLVSLNMEQVFGDFIPMIRVEPVKKYKTAGSYEVAVDCFVSEIALEDGKRSIRRSSGGSEFDRIEAKVLWLNWGRGQAPGTVTVVGLLLALQNPRTSGDGVIANGYERIGLVYDGASNVRDGCEPTGGQVKEWGVEGEVIII